MTTDNPKGGNMEVSVVELIELELIYNELIADLPELAVKKPFPSFERFLSPANFSMFDHVRSTYELSITGKQRCQLLRSPHAKTLFRGYIAKYLL